MPRTPQPCQGIGTSKELRDLLDVLDEDHNFKKWIDKMADELLLDRGKGQAIGKGRIPAYYVDVYNVNNLYRYGHPEGYRSCYTILQPEKDIFHVWILDLLSHQEYEDRFGYR